LGSGLLDNGIEGYYICDSLGAEGVSEMSETVINVAVDERTKREAEAALAPLGLTSSEFLRRVVEGIARARAGASIEGGDLPDDVLERFIKKLEERPISPGVRQALERLAKARDPLEEPTAETIAAIEEARRGEFIGEFRTPEELIAHLNVADD
jgi:antitoxin component of RelBE/YafQ-DinJ toxin-antitoxin module